MAGKSQVRCSCCGKRFEDNQMAYGVTEGVISNDELIADESDWIKIVCEDCLDKLNPKPS